MSTRHTDAQRRKARARSPGAKQQKLLDNRRSEICCVRDCTNPKVCLNQAYKKCAEHGGVEQLWAILASECKSHSARKDSRLRAADIGDICAKQQGECFYCSIPLLLRRGTRSPDQVSVERVNDGENYRKDNVVLTCWLCNRMRNKNSWQLMESFLLVWLGGDASAREIHHHANRNWANAVIKSANKEDKKSGLTPEWTKALMMEKYDALDGRCQASGIKMCRCDEPRCLFKASIDRIDNGKGHTLANSRLVCFGINSARGDLSIEQFEKEVERRRTGLLSQISSADCCVSECKEPKAVRAGPTRPPLCIKHGGTGQLWDHLSDRNQIAARELRARFREQGGVCLWCKVPLLLSSYSTSLDALIVDKKVFGRPKRMGAKGFVICCQLCSLLRNRANIDLFRPFAADLFAEAGKGCQSAGRPNYWTNVDSNHAKAQRMIRWVGEKKLCSVLGVRVCCCDRMQCPYMVKMVGSKEGGGVVCQAARSAMRGCANEGFLRAAVARRKNLLKVQILRAHKASSST